MMSGRKTAAQMARMFNVSPLIVSRIVASHILNLCLQAGSNLLLRIANRTAWVSFNIYGY
jgi:hypothetical protein